MALFSKENIENLKQDAKNRFKGEKKSICPECGAEIPDEALFCFMCGTRIEEKENEAAEEETEDENFYDAPFIHELDRKSLKALKAIPGFTTIMKKYIKIFNEEQFRIINLSSNIRISENQLPEIYNLLPPICSKLGIEMATLIHTNAT